MSNAICEHRLPTDAQVYEYYDRVGYEAMEPRYQELYNMYIELEANGNHVCVNGGDLAGPVLAFFIGCMVGYLYYKLGGK